MTPRRRTRSRLVLRDLSATAAFASIVLSGSVPLIAVVAFGLALALSLWGRRPLSARPTVSVVVLLFSALLLFGAAFRGLLDLVVAACTFAGLVTSHRLLSEPSTGTDQQVHLTSLLTLAGGAALTGELWFGLCLAAFALCSSLSLGLSVLEPASGVLDEDLPVGPAVSRVSLGTGMAIVGGVLFFVFFPRLSWNIAARRMAPGLGGTTGMSDRVRLGGSGDIKSSPRVVARVKLSPSPNADRLDAYWPGRSFDLFDGREWSGTGEPRPARPQVQLARPRRGAVQQQVQLLPGYDARTLIGLEHPIFFTDAVAMSTTGSARTSLVEVPDEEVHFVNAGNGYAYSVVSIPEDLPQLSPGDLERYRQPPQGLDPRVAQLAEHVVQAERRPLKAAELLRRHLQREYSYTLELSGEVADPLLDFLFVRKAGHCEHFATALTVLLRSQHIPARVTAGFFGGERLGGDTYVLRAGDAHAWTEVYDPERGWVTFDATPDSGRGSQPTKALAWFVDRYEELTAWWRARVVDYSFQDQVEIARSLVKPPREGGRARLQLPALSDLLPTLVALAAAMGVYVFVQRFGRGGAKRRHPAASFLDEIEARLQRAGVALPESEPIEETRRRLQASSHPLAPALGLATRAYLEARFGDQPLTAARRRELLEGLAR